MAKIIRLTESDLTRIVRRVIKEQSQPEPLVTINYDGNEVVESYVNKQYSTGTWKKESGDIDLKPDKRPNVMNRIRISPENLNKLTTNFGTFTISQDGTLRLFA